SDVCVCVCVCVCVKAVLGPSTERLWPTHVIDRIARRSSRSFLTRIPLGRLRLPNTHSQHSDIVLLGRWQPVVGSQISYGGAAGRDDAVEAFLASLAAACCPALGDSSTTVGRRSLALRPNKEEVSAVKSVLKRFQSFQKIRRSLNDRSPDPIVMHPIRRWLGVARAP
ncbi:hypothetical protein DFJ73DRAFT_810824, partial [Zopfochytrium polystomum]